MVRRGAQKVTLKTIAEAAGVHTSTVSRALDATGSDQIGAETVRKVRRLAASLGYEPNLSARSLRTQRTLTVGLLLPLLTDPVLAEMFEAAEEQARRHGYQAITASTGDRESDQQRLIDGLLERRVDGLILATALINDPTMDNLAARGVPFQLMNRACGDHPSVRGDDELGGYLATRHLLSQGHTRVAVVVGPMSTSTAQDRLAGFQRAHVEAGLGVDPTLVIETSFRVHGGINAGNHLLGLRRPPTAVFAVNDATAIGVMAVARDLGLHVPDDLAVVGYNDNEISAMLSVPLSSVALPLRQLGALAVDLIVEQLDGMPARSMMLSPTLRVRASSAVVRRPGRSQG